MSLKVGREVQVWGCFEIEHFLFSIVYFRDLTLGPRQRLSTVEMITYIFAQEIAENDVNEKRSWTGLTTTWNSEKLL